MKNIRKKIEVDSQQVCVRCSSKEEREREFSNFAQPTFPGEPFYPPGYGAVLIVRPDQTVAVRRGRQLGRGRRIAAISMIRMAAGAFVRRYVTGDGRIQFHCFELRFRRLTVVRENRVFQAGG